MPSVPPPEHCEPLGTEPVPGSDGLQIAHRPAGPLPLSGSDRAHALVWMRLAEERPVDALAATVIADGAVPALFCAIDEYVAMPTIELAVHFADVDAASESPWLLGSFTNVCAADGWATEDGELWTLAGQLVALTLQLRRIADPNVTR